MTSSTAFAALAQGAVACPLDELGSLRFEGPDAASFLQGQLSSDVGALRPGASQRSSYHSARGRMLASLRLWLPDAPEGGAFGALIAADLASAVARRLRMFVLRAKVNVADASAEQRVLGVAGPAASEAVTAVFGAAPAPGAVMTVERVTLLGLPDGRMLVVGPHDAAADLHARLAAHATAAEPALWRTARVLAGVPLVRAATSDLFVPQALNFDVLEGISFRKGCYPGQEIVARTQYLGRLKERLFAFRVDGDEPAPSTRLHSATFGDQACGTVVDAGPHPDGGSVLLAVVQRAAVDDAAVHLGAPDGPRLARVELPYAVPEPVPPRGRIA
jgi:folate-binding protein YgfZ